MRLDKVLTVLGRTFIGAGLLVFLFVAYQLWGTNITEARAQNKLRAEAARGFLEEGGTTSTSTTLKTGQTAPPNTTPAPPPAPQGKAVAVISIPKIGLQKAVVEGTGVPDLKKGPGHYTNTPLPGQPGNAAIAGHRTTYGAPFGDIGELKPGDLIQVTTKQGLFTYKVTSSKVVDPGDVSVLAPTKDNRLTLTTCHPKYSASKRLVVFAKLDTNPAPAPPPTTVPPTTAPPKGSPSTTSTTENPAAQLSGADLSGTPTDKLPALLWGLAAAIVGVTTYVLSRLWRRWLAYLIGTPIFLIVLFVFFESFSRLLPTNA